MKIEKIISCISVGVRDCFDLEVDSEFHNFYAQGVVVSNSHAVAYAKIAAITAKLKGEYPQEFFLEALKVSQKKQNPFEHIQLIQQEIPHFGIKLLPPDLIKSDMDFTLEGPDIRFGLSAIKGVAEKALSKLQSFLDRDKTNKFQVFYAAKETGLNVGVLSALIQSGCLHSIGSDRARMVCEAQIWSKLSPREWNYCLANGHKYDYDLLNALKDYLNWNDGKPFSESRLGTIRKHCESYIKLYNKNKAFPEFCSFVYEKTMLGFSPSTNLRSVFARKHENLQSCHDVKNVLDIKDRVSIVGEVVEFFKRKNKSGEDYLQLRVADETGNIECKMGSGTFARYIDNNVAPAEDDIIYLEGSKAQDTIWIERLSIYREKIYFRVNDLKKADKFNKGDNEDETDTI